MNAANSTVSASDLAARRLQMVRRPAQADSGGKYPLVLLHGWGHTSACWEPLLAALPADRDILLVDLPGFGLNRDLNIPDVDSLLDLLEEQLPEPSVLLGWSLGGHLAVRLAARAGTAVAGVVTVATNSTFVSRSHWPNAMAEDTFSAFYQQFLDSPAATLKRFCGLQVQGEPDARAALKAMRELCPAPDTAQLPQWQAALAWLGQLDHREDLPRLSENSLHLFGEHDALVPMAAAKQFKHISPGQVQVLPTGHAPHLSQPNAVAHIIDEFLQSLAGEGAAADEVDKQRMARAFSRAAATYDSVAHVQVAVGEALFDMLPEAVAGQSVLDLGCGTGFCTEWLQRADAQVTALDIAPGMLQQAQRKLGESAAWVCADAEQLPFKAQAFDGLVSNLTVQWSGNLPALLAALAAVLRPGAWMLFSTLGPRTLHELRDAWLQVDGYTHVNRFASKADLHHALAAAGLEVATFAEQDLVPQYEQVNVLMRELKALGAHNANNGQNRGLTSPGRLRALSQAYDSHRNSDGLLPATYEVFYTLARKT